VSNKEQHVPSLELSKKLYELGVRKKSVFYWLVYSGKYERNPKVVSFGKPPNNFLFDYSIFYPAYLASELGEMLPQEIKTIHYKFPLKIHREKNDTWDISYNASPQSNGVEEIWTQADTLDNAMAKMLIWLIEQGHVKVEEL